MDQFNGLRFAQYLEVNDERWEVIMLSNTTYADVFLAALYRKDHTIGITISMK
jgi:hypothetical protein